MGYRIQVFVGGKTRADKRKAESTASTIRSLFPEHKVYVHFYSPRWLAESTPRSPWAPRRTRSGGKAARMEKRGADGGPRRHPTPTRKQVNRQGRLPGGGVMSQ